MNPDYKSPCPCGECKPRSMLGASWYKNLGFNTPSDCAQALYEQGHRYLSQWACMYCTDSNGVFDHYPKCDQCIE